MSRALAFKTTKRLVVAVIGGTVVLLGVVMIVAPGPAIIVIPVGLAILATEFLWARRLLGHVKDRMPSRFKKPVRRKRSWVSMDRRG